MAQAFLNEGMNVAIADVDAEALARAKSALSGSNARVLAVQLDVTDRAQYEAVARKVDGGTRQRARAVQQRRCLSRRRAGCRHLRRLGLGDGRERRRRHQRPADVSLAHAEARRRRPRRQHRVDGGRDDVAGSRRVQHQQVCRGRHERSAAQRHGAARHRRFGVVSRHGAHAHSRERAHATRRSST